TVRPESSSQRLPQDPAVRADEDTEECSSPPVVTLDRVVELADRVKVAIGSEEDVVRAVQATGASRNEDVDKRSGVGAGGPLVAVDGVVSQVQVSVGAEGHGAAEVADPSAACRDVRTHESTSGPIESRHVAIGAVAVVTNVEVAVGSEGEADRTIQPIA